MTTTILVLLIGNLVLTLFVFVIVLFSGAGAANLGEKVLDTIRNNDEAIQNLNNELKNRMPSRIYGEQRNPNLTDGPADSRISR